MVIRGALLQQLDDQKIQETLYLLPSGGLIPVRDHIGPA
jgi:hypothetical protein